MSCTSSLSFPRSPSPHLQPPTNYHHHLYHHHQLKLSPRPGTSIRSLMMGAEEIAGIAHNKVLVAATLASAIGQLSKPLTSAIRGKGVDVKAAIGSGGMPSTHSAGVVAAATSLGLERGFSDSIFGMSVVFAAIIMYDAQGVRREVGYHAKILNRILNIQEKPALNQEGKGLIDSKLAKSPVNSENFSPLVARSEKENSDSPNQDLYMFRNSRISSKWNSLRRLDIEQHDEQSENIFGNHNPLNESVGHTEIQVLVGALLGFVVSLALDTIL